jgi:potassium-transporting ATPase KdpC subunit
MLRNELKIAIRFTLLTTVLLGILYPLAVTAIGHLALPHQADGELIVTNGQVTGSRLIGQSFTGDQYFHGRPSAAGNGYDATSSSPSNYAASNQKLISRINGDVAHYAAENKGAPVPIDLVTASGSGLDPDISPAAALFQAERVATARHLPLPTVRDLIQQHVQGRQFGFLGEERVNVLLLNMDLDRIARSSRG